MANDIDSHFLLTLPVVRIILHRFYRLCTCVNARVTDPFIKGSNSCGHGLTIWKGLIEGYDGQELSSIEGISLNGPSSVCTSAITLYMRKCLRTLPDKG